MSDDRRDKGLFDDDDALSPTEPPASGVRITGASPASDDILADWALDADRSPEAALPPWTDEATGQVPAVLSRPDDGDGDPWASVESPTWREESSDWEAGDEVFDTSMLSSHEEPLGALNPEPEMTESQPWEFDIAGQPPAAAEPAVLAASAGDEWAAPDRVVSDDAVPVARRRGSQSRTRSEDDGPTRSRRPPFSESFADAAKGSSDGGGRNMPVAVITGVIIALLVLVTFNIGTVLAMLLVIVVVTLAAAEAYAAFRRGGQHPATLLGLVATVALLIATYNRGPQALGLVTVLLVAFTIVWFMVGVEKANMITGAASTFFVFGWVGVFGSYAALLLNPNLFPSRHGLAFLLGAILVTISYDIAALFVGQSMGRKSLAPEISPNKTIEGLVGGSVAAILVAVIVVHLIAPWTLSSALVLGIIVTIVAPLGDLAESMIKRNLGIKDMGRLLPGHGGMLDRVDGLLFVLPATYYLVRAFNLG
ncbi:MAG: phosphatidate cytidylyltransferase [Actinomycetes bacterium]